jgi:hypothetical protein
MKSYILKAVALSLIISLSACKKDTPSEKTVEALNNGDWRVTLYEDDGKDELYHFNGYTFTFKDGNITATKANSSTISGTYSAGTDDSKNKLILSFGNTDPFEELNDDWEILEQTSGKIKLKDVSGGNGGTDYLTFEKN